MHPPELPDDHHPKTHTDLPLLPGGNNGNKAAALAETVAEVAHLFREAIELLPQPPYETLDAGAVVDWIDRATAGAERRRECQRLLRAAERVLWDDWRSAMASERLRDQLVRQAAVLSARQAGTYWRARDGRRRANLPAHVV